MAKAKGTYSGRLMCDGYGNLLADESKLVGYKEFTIKDDEGNPVLDNSGAETVVRVPQFKFGENHGLPVAHHDGSYIFLNSGDDSHNDRHHKQFAEIVRTDDVDDGRQAHHLEIQPDDSHYDESADNKTRLRFSADKVAATETGHTDAYTGGDE